MGAETKWRDWVLQGGSGYDSVNEATEPKANSLRNWRFVQFHISIPVDIYI